MQRGRIRARGFQATFSSAVEEKVFLCPEQEIAFRDQRSGFSSRSGIAR